MQKITFEGILKLTALTACEDYSNYLKSIVSKARTSCIKMDNQPIKTIDFEIDNDGCVLPFGENPKYKSRPLVAHINACINY
jgi:hypothetical protein